MMLKTVDMLSLGITTSQSEAPKTLDSLITRYLLLPMIQTVLYLTLYNYCY